MHSCAQRSVLGAAGRLAICAAIFLAALPATSATTGIEGVAAGLYLYVSLSPAASKSFGFRSTHDLCDVHVAVFMCLH